MRAKDFLISESFVDAFKGYRGEECTIYKNPTPKEWKQCQGYEEVRAFLVGNDILIWPVFAAMHQHVRDYLKLGRDALSVTIMGKMGDDAHVSVTDNSKQSDWWHDSSTGYYIQHHPFISQKFEDNSVSYYDEAIEGDWENM